MEHMLTCLKPLNSLLAIKKILVKTAPISDKRFFLSKQFVEVFSWFSQEIN